MLHRVIELICRYRVILGLLCLVFTSLQRVVRVEAANLVDIVAEILVNVHLGLLLVDVGVRVKCLVSVHCL